MSPEALRRNAGNTQGIIPLGEGQLTVLAEGDRSLFSPAGLYVNTIKIRRAEARRISIFIGGDKRDREPCGSPH